MFWQLVQKYMYQYVHCYFIHALETCFEVHALLINFKSKNDHYSFLKNFHKFTIILLITNPILSIIVKNINIVRCLPIVDLLLQLS